MAGSYPIGALARLAGVHVETIRYYERRLLLRQPPRPYGSIRRYGDEHLARLLFIKRAQAAGFSLAEVTALLRNRERPSCRATRDLTREKLKSVEARLGELAAVRDELRAWVAQCDTNEVEEICPALAAMEGTADSG